jgi:xanthine dehydrogenase iron-sulfur cluster and FAD-binding subunit A
MPDAAIRFARGVSSVRTPEHLVSLRTLVREQHHAELATAHEALYERFNRASEDYVNVFRAAAELAVMERVGGDQLPTADRRILRDLWEALLHAK